MRRTVRGRDEEGARMKETRYENYRVTVNVDLWLCSGANAHDNALRRCQIPA